MYKSRKRMDYFMSHRDGYIDGPTQKTRDIALTINVQRSNYKSKFHHQRLELFFQVVFIVFVRAQRNKTFDVQSGWQQKELLQHLFVLLCEEWSVLRASVVVINTDLCDKRHPLKHTPTKAIRRSARVSITVFERWRKWARKQKNASLQLVYESNQR